MQRHRSTQRRVSNETPNSNFEAGTALEHLRAEVVDIEALARAADALPTPTTNRQRVVFGRIRNQLFFAMCNSETIGLKNQLDTARPTASGTRRRGVRQRSASRPTADSAAGSPGPYTIGSRSTVASISRAARSTAISTCRGRAYTPHAGALLVRELHE